MTADKRMTISVAIINRIVGYLGTCPYQDVAAIIQAMQADLKPQEPAKEPAIDGAPLDLPG